MDALSKLQSFFRELFQLDLADLDFGIYRLLNLKRKEVEAFLAERLPKEAERAFKAAVGDEQAQLEKELKELAKRIKDVSEEAILPNGDINPSYSKGKLAKEYQTKRSQLLDVRESEAQKAEVFNHLYNFFSRYYDAGDFIPRRFYGSREQYAVPYNGEEVFSHWANKDQHYVKTGESFRDYVFSVKTLAKTYRVHFKLVEASTPKDNTKGDIRFFFPLPEEAIYDTDTYILPFHYRLPTVQEVEKYGTNAKGQDAVVAESVTRILDSIREKGLQTQLAEVVAVKNPEDPKKREEISLLLKRLRHFTKKNSTDYFVHKDLGGFLRQELEFYVKDQVLHQADLEGDFETKRRMLRVFRALADQVITFLAQIEDVQKRLFEKKKFVLRAGYLIPIQNISQSLWPEILKNKEQLATWKKLFGIEPKKDLFNPKGQINERFLKEHPTLVVDTSHFDSDTSLRILAELEDIELSTAGLLLESENYQALKLTSAAMSTRFDCVYIDPPYNTGSDEFIYKDRYRHSSWMAMMRERLALVKTLMSPHGAFFSSIDLNEIAALKPLLEDIFGSGNAEGLISWRRRHNQPNDRTKMIGLVSEYILAFAKDSDALRKAGVGKLDLTGSFSNPDKDPRGDWASKPWKVGSGQSGTRYKITAPSGKVYDEEWMGDENNYKALLKDKRIFFPNNGKGSPRKKYFKSEREEEGQCATNWWSHDLFGHNAQASSELADLFGEKGLFDNPKPVDLMRGIIQVAGRSVSSVLDYFAGSGTTGHAVLRLNREDGENRKFLLVELGDYFDSVLVPRIQKVMFAPEWKDGKPSRLPTKEEAERTPRLVKILRLESYEDALQNIASDAALKKAEGKTEAVKTALGEDAYRLQYLVKLPLEASDTMLNVAKLEHPFDYAIETVSESGPRLQKADLVETFNWLYGLKVKRLESWMNEKDKVGGKGRIYRIVKATDRENRKRILVVWRDMTGLNPKTEREFLEAKAKEAGPFEEMLINGDSATPGFASLDGLFKRLMEEGES